MLGKKIKKIGFLIQYPFHFFVFKNIAINLKEQGEEVEFIIDPTGYFPVKPTDETLVKIKEILSRSGFEYKEFIFGDFLSRTKVTSFLDSYKVLVSTWHRGLISDTDTIKKVFVTYGAGKELTTFGFWKRNFDLCLSYGDYDDVFFKQLTQSAVVGNPKFDDWFSGNFDGDLLVRLREWSDVDKKTVLYLPTHSDLCSIKELAGQLKMVSKFFNVIVKLHYYTPREQPELVEMLRDKSIFLFEDNSDLITLLSFSDAVISDSSSAIFDAMLANKPILVTDFLSKEYLDSGHHVVRSYRRGWAGALTFSNSIEQRIKKEGIVCTIKRPEDLKIGIEEALLDTRKEKRILFTDTLFKYKDKFSGKRGARAIIELVEQKEIPPTPYLAFALNKFENSLQSASFLKQEEGDKFFCFVIFDSVENDVNLVEQRIQEVSLFSFRKKIVVISFRNTLKKISGAEVFFAKDFVLTLSTLSKEITDFIFIYPEVSFFGEKRPNLLLEKLETQLCNIKTSVASGYIKEKNTRWFNLSRRVLLIEKYQSFGIAALLYKKFSPEVVTNFWNSGVDDPRFFIIKKEHLLNTIELFRGQIINFYSLLLASRVTALRKNGNETNLNLILFTDVYRKNFILSKYKTRALFETTQGFPVLILIKRFFVLILFSLLQGWKGFLPLIILFRLFFVSLLIYILLKLYFLLKISLDTKAWGKWA